MRSSTHRWRYLLSLIGASAISALIWRHMRRNPTAFRYSEHRLEIPRPFLTRDDLRDVLGPKTGETILEVGPGKGYYSRDVARWISPDGSLHILDVQREMLEHTSRSAEREGITNITATLSDAADLPYSDDTFDAAFLVAVLGEVPDRLGAIRELRRVLKPGGRLVVGEAITDPHRVSSGDLRELAEGVGFKSVRGIGGALGRFHLFIA